MEFFNVKDIQVADLIEALSDCDVVKHKRQYYINAACSFDIETTSFYKGQNKQSLMYLWQLDINGFCVYGRYWSEFVNLINALSTELELSHDLILVIYVHNLAYEFQFMRKYFTWEKVFAREKRKPMKALTTNGIEFRCSLILSGYSLAKVAENLHSHTIKKLTEDMDYSLMRSPVTKLTDKELEYSYNDIKIVEYFIREEMERNGDIVHIPLTQTGYIRRMMRENCFPRSNVNKIKKYKARMNDLLIDGMEEYKQLKRAFAGGFTHANAFYSMQTIPEVSSIDFNSSYPAVMVNEMYPMSGAHLISEINTRAEFDRYTSMYCCIFDVEFENLDASTIYDHPISYSKCFICEGEQQDNGRIVTAKRIALTMTEVDFSYVEKFYTWDAMYISNFRWYYKDYLPTEIVETIGKLYQAKTALKGVEGKEVEYMHSKGLLNSTFGMMVTDICPNEIVYDGDWLEKPYDENDIERYNKQRQRFLYYPWGVYVTAYARRNLFLGIYEFGTDYIYSDTDSIKCKNYEKHLDFVNAYNDDCISKSKDAIEHHKLPLDYVAPLDKKGCVRDLGVWDFEGTYSKFKTMGAKRYLVEKDGKHNLTVSGVNKKFAVPYMEQMSGDIFDNFNENLVIPAKHTGKKILTYIDDEFEGDLTDYQGNVYHYHEQTGIHMEDTSYNFNMSQVYLDFLRGITTDRFGG